MGLFSKIFKKDRAVLFPATDFGRYSDSYKSGEEFDHWDQAVSFFEKGKFIQSVHSVFAFLSIPGQQNIVWEEKKGTMHFQLWQGSVQIQGTADRKGFRAETAMFTAKDPSLGLMRFLLESNYGLKFCRYAVNESDEVCLIFDTSSEDAPPQKLYQGLRELAMESDKMDEELQKKFTDLAIVSHPSMIALSAGQKKQKLAFARHWASDVLREINHGRLNTHIYPGGPSFLMLDLLYRIDALLRPEGNWKEQIRQCHEMFFGEEGKEVFEKNKVLLDFTHSMAHQKGLHLEGDLYRAPFTFGYAQPQGHRQFADVYDSQMAEFEWYYESHYDAYARAICGYIAGHCLYQYALPEPTRDFLVLFYRLTIPAFFSDFGYEEVYLKEMEQKKQVLEEISRIVDGYSSEFEGLAVDTSLLRFDDMALFCASFLGMVRNIQYRDF